MSIKSWNSGIVRVLLVSILLAGSLGSASARAATEALPSSGETVRVSLSSGGQEGNDHSYGPALSADGHYVVFYSEAANLVPGDTNAVEDVFVHDTLTGATTRVSVASGGSQGNASSWMPSISADGRYVAFSSVATNLVPGDTNGEPDVFVHDTWTHATMRVSVDSSGGQANGASYGSISADGRYVVFESTAANLVANDTNGMSDIFLRDIRSGVTGRISVAANGGDANGDSGDPSLSADGRRIAYFSLAGNLVPGDLNSAYDVFVYDIGTGETSLASVDSQGVQGNDDSTSPQLSEDGRFVTFDSQATNLVPNDSNGVIDIFLHDLQTGGTSRVSVATGGAQANGSSIYPSLSQTGRYVAFTSYATNLAPGDANETPDVFVHDRLSGATTRVSVSSGNAEGNKQSGEPSISASGQYVSFTSYASNLVPGDANVSADIFVHRPQWVASTILYVKQGATGGNTGTSWADAYSDLQPALTAATAGAEIWVAAGTYKPATVPDRNISFVLKNDVAVYGGFAGTETLRSERDPSAHVTILSGDIGTTGVQSDNSYHVVVGSGTNSSAILDGFIVSGGNADGVSPNDMGGGMYNLKGSPQVADVTFENNAATFGGGMYNGGESWATSSSEASNPILTNVVFQGNTSKMGGGMNNRFYSSPFLMNVIFRANTATRDGGGMENYGESRPSLTNVIFEDNSAPAGGGMANSQAGAILTNVTFTNNAANAGGGMANFQSSPSLKNVTFSGNTVTKDTVEDFGGYGGGMSNEYYSNPVLEKVTFDGNSAENGGGMSNSQSGPGLTDVIFSNNSVTIYGGGMSNDDHSNPTLNNVTFSGNAAQNTSDTYGGGMTNQQSSPSLTNVTFYNNSATYGGGMLNRDVGSSPTLSHVTFSNNTASVEGGAIANDGSMLIRNSIFWGNQGGEIFNLVVNGTPAVVTYSIVQGGYPGIGNLDADPHLGPLQNNGGYSPTLALGPGSAAIDSGDDENCASTDQRGVTRPQGSHCDMGAYEAVPDTAAPALSSFTRHDPETSPTNADTLVFRATFSEAVAQVDASDFLVNGTTTATVTNVAVVDPGTYDVTVSGGDLAGFNGVVGLDLSEAQDIEDLAGNALPDGEPATDQTYTLDNSLLNIDVNIGGELMGSYVVPVPGSERKSYTGVGGGPVRVASQSGDPIIASERINLKTYDPLESYAEVMGLPASKLSDTYIFPWYNNTGFLDSQLRFANVGNANTVVTIKIAGVAQPVTYPLAPNQGARVSFPGVDQGPVEIKSSNGVPIIAALRINLKTGSPFTSYSEFLGLSASDIAATRYLFPWYNNTGLLDSQLRFANIGSDPTTVMLKIGGVVQNTYDLAPNASTRISLANIDKGPVEVTSSGGVPITAAMRINLKNNTSYTSYTELMGMTGASLTDTRYLFPWYNNTGSLDSQLRFANVGNTKTIVSIKVNGVVQPTTYLLAPDQSTRISLPGVNNGPVEVYSSGGVPIIAALRINLKASPSYDSYYEFMGMSVGLPLELPTNQLSSTYWFPWYNNTGLLDSQLRFGVP